MLKVFAIRTFRFVNAHPWIGATLLVPLIHLIPLIVGHADFRGSLPPDIARAVFLAVVIYGVLGCCCWPLTRYRTVVSTVVVFSGCMVLISVVWQCFSAFWETTDMRSWCYSMLTHFIQDALIFVLPLIAATFVRKRFWPVHPPGHCQRCGYSLHGLESSKCPECGTPFDRSLTQQDSTIATL